MTPVLDLHAVVLAEHAMMIRSLVRSLASSLVTMFTALSFSLSEPRWLTLGKAHRVRIMVHSSTKKKAFF